MPRGSEIKLLIWFTIDFSKIISEQASVCKSILDFGISLEQILTLSILKGSLIELIQNQTHIFHLDNSKWQFSIKYLLSFYLVLFSLIFKPLFPDYFSYKTQCLIKSYLLVYYGVNQLYSTWKQVEDKFFHPKSNTLKGLWTIFILINRPKINVIFVRSGSKLEYNQTTGIWLNLSQKREGGYIVQYNYYYTV